VTLIFEVLDTVAANRVLHRNALAFYRLRPDGGSGISGAEGG
jgi:hypothetical protein